MQVLQFHPKIILLLLPVNFIINISKILGKFGLSFPGSLSSKCYSTTAFRLLPLDCHLSTVASFSLL